MLEQNCDQWICERESGATPAGLYYTTVYYLSDGTTTTQYRRINAAQLLAILDDMIYQPAAWVLSGGLAGSLGVDGAR
jgi:hypothetical protein